MNEDDSDGSSLSTSRAIVAALNALQKRVDVAETARRVDAVKAKEHLEATLLELDQTRQQMESLQLEFESERKKHRQEVEKISEQRDKALADLAVSRHTVQNLREEVKLAKSLIAAVPLPSPRPNNDPAPAKLPSERNVEIVLPSVQPTEPAPSTPWKTNDELERLVHNLLQMNSTLKDERDSVRKQLKLSLSTPRPVGASATVPSFAQPCSRSRQRTGQHKTKENREPMIRCEEEKQRKKASKPKTRPPSEIKATESKLRWIQHCIDEIAKNGGINLKNRTPK